MKFNPIFIHLFLLFNGLFINATAQVSIFEDPFRVEAYRLEPDEIFKLDGRLDEPFWQKINPITNFTQQEPREGEIPTERSEIYIAYDDNNLYIGARLYDSEADQILAYQKRRNQSLATDDRFMWILDTFNSGRNAYFFETNPAGLKGDGLLSVSQSTNLNKAWDGIWDVRTIINEEGWVVEIVIPFRTLDFNPDNMTWGINFQRTIRRKNEEIIWAGWRRNQGLFRPQNAGIITGLERLDQGLGLEVTPFATTVGNRSWPSGQSSINNWSADAGFDVSYNITPGIRASLTVNTDFAETEVDQRRVNLSRFPLLFPEQRDFFLEGSNIFSFVPESSIRPFFSRRIGLVEGEPIPLDLGIKALGRTGNTNLGFYQIRTGGTEYVNPEDFTVARISQNIFEESSVGVIYTRRSTLGDDFYLDRHTIGADLELITSKFMGDKNLAFQAFFVGHNMHTSEEGTSIWDRSSRGIRLAYPNHPISAHISYREFGEMFNPAVGFAPRVAFRRVEPAIGYQHVFNGSRLLRSWQTRVLYRHLTDLSLNPETVNLELTPMNLVFESGEQITVGIYRNFERLTFDFDILRDETIIIPQGDYHAWGYDINFRTASYRKLSGRAGLIQEGFWTGERVIYNLFITIRPFPGINLSGNWSRTDANLNEGNFQTDLVQFSGNIDLSPSTAATNIIQFDNVSDLIGLYNRFRWTIRPGADLYMVFTYNWIQIDNRFSPLESQGAVKLSFTHRF